MAKTQNASKQAGVTRGKAILIAVLGVVFLGVIYKQYGGSGGEDGASLASAAPYTPPGRRAARGRAPQAAPEVDAERQIQAAALLEFDQAKWIAPQLTAVVAHDPFALPASFPRTWEGGDPHLALDSSTDAAAAQHAKEMAEALERLQMQLEDLKQRGVHVIVNKQKQYVAMIGDRLIHVGDEINGFTVTEIDPTGVRVERKDLE